MKYICKVILFKYEEGNQFYEACGRHNPTFQGYRTHVIVTPNSKLEPELLGVQFNTDMIFGLNPRVEIEPLFEGVDYSSLTKDQAFCIVEGRHQVGIGVILEIN